MFNSYVVVPPVTGWLAIELDKEIIDYLWNQIDESNVSVKDQLAGHITSSLSLKDKDDFFANNVLIPAAEKYYNNFRVTKPTHIKCNSLILNDFWVNFQKKHEFNPLHDHGGMFSFVIWMKIPTKSEEQNKLEFLKDQKKPVASSFELTYVDTSGRLAGFVYPMNPDMEGKMLFFPSFFKHSVYPFYECDDTRISISGNLYYT